jgi:hypothetical protein
VSLKCASSIASLLVNCGAMQRWAQYSLLILSSLRLRSQTYLQERAICYKSRQPCAEAITSECCQQTGDKCLRTGWIISGQVIQFLGRVRVTIRICIRNTHVLRDVCAKADSVRVNCAA